MWPSTEIQVYIHVSVFSHPVLSLFYHIIILFTRECYCISAGRCMYQLRFESNYTKRPTPLYRPFTGSTCMWLCDRKTSSRSSTYIRCNIQMNMQGKQSMKQKSFPRMQRLNYELQSDFPAVEFWRSLFRHNKKHIKHISHWRHNVESCMVTIANHVGFNNPEQTCRST